MTLLSEAHSAANLNPLGTVTVADMIMSMLVVVLLVMLVLVAVVELVGIRADKASEIANVIRGQQHEAIIPRTVR